MVFDLLAKKKVPICVASNEWEPFKIMQKRFYVNNQPTIFKPSIPLWNVNSALNLILILEITISATKLHG